MGLLLEVFGIVKKFERRVTLHQGPNKRSNRYLVHQYTRLIKSIDGTMLKGDKSTMSNVVWQYDFYRLSSPNADLTNSQKKILRKKARTYWGIANQLIRKSLAFRIAVLKKSLGKTGRWFHRDFDIRELFEFNRDYQKISEKFDSQVKIKRTWICTEQRDGSFKVRPLGISPYPWRIFTRGVNNMLETFISGSWPDNQHGYKSGRGVHTVWNQVLRTVIKAKYIIEFDFTGFFNTVRAEAVGDVLNRMFVPKYMCAYLVNMSTTEVKNISVKGKHEWELGEWLDVAIGDIDLSSVPKIVADHLKSYSGNIGYTKVTWRNLYMDPIFATFVARMFQDTFRSGVVKQSFRLTHDREKLNLVKVIDRYVGRQDFQSSLMVEDLISSTLPLSVAIYCYSS